MAEKLGRNERCWCGSGKKFKKCHLDREKQPPIQSWEVDAQIRSRSKSGECLNVAHTNGSICREPAIGSHTVSRKMLKQIARNGHVYHHSATMQDLDKTQGGLQVKLIGVNDASVLRVFCQKHDSETFAPLEQAPFVGNREQCFLLAYRALCNEFSKKRDVLNSIHVMKGFDRGKTLEDQVAIQSNMDTFAMGNSVAVRDMLNHKKQFDSMLAARDYAEIRAYVVTFDNTPEILCSGGLFPECDFAGQPLQDLGNLSKQLEQITYSLIVTESGGAFVFAWHNSGDGACRPLATSLDRLPDGDLPHAIVRFILEFCENHYLNPEWWDKADRKIKDALTERLQIAASPWMRRSSSCLVDDGLRAVSWNVTGRTWL